MLTKQISLRRLISVTIIACAVLLSGNTVIANQEDSQSTPPCTGDQKGETSDEQDPIKGYPSRERRVGTPTDVENDLDYSFPKDGSLLELMLRSKEAQP